MLLTHEPTISELLSGGGRSDCPRQNRRDWAMMIEWEGYRPRGVCKEPEAKLRDNAIESMAGSSVAMMPPPSAEIVGGVERASEVNPRSSSLLAAVVTLTHFRDWLVAL